MQFAGAVIQKANPDAIRNRRRRFIGLISCCMTENEGKPRKIPLAVSRKLSIDKVTLLQFVPQPNKKFSLSLLLEESELPGSGWQRTVDQTFRTGALRKRDPINTRAKSIKSTSARRGFKNSANSDSILVEVTPFASHEDASIRAENFVEPLIRRLSKVVNVIDHEVMEGPGLRELDPYRCLQYRFRTQAGGIRSSRGLAGAVDEYGVHVGVVSDTTPWEWQAILDLTSLQVKKIREVIGTGSS
jgi:hypothetical protein